MADRNFISFIALEHEPDHAGSAMRITVWTCVVTILLLAGYTRYEGWHGEFVPGFLLVGAMLAFTMWGSHRLWTMTIAPIVRNFSRWIALATKIPFLYMAGGIGYTTGMLTAKVAGLLVVYDRPVNALFFFGGKFAVALYIITLLILLKISGIRTATGYDKDRTARDH